MKRNIESNKALQNEEHSILESDEKETSCPPAGRINHSESVREHATNDLLDPPSSI